MTEDSIDNGTPKKKDHGKLGVHVLVVTFGITSWSIMNGLWLELPILVSNLPEGWTLPSLLTIVTQFGNLGPLLFSFFAYLAPRRKLEIPASFIIVVVLSLCALLYAFLWRETATLAGNEYSVALLSLTFVQSVFATTTSQAYLALMSHLKAVYISSLFLGMSLSGLLPAIAAVIQGSGEVSCSGRHNTSQSDENSLYTSADGVIYLSNNTTGLQKIQREPVPRIQVQALSLEPEFTVQHFFLLLFVLGLFSLVSLFLLLYHPKCHSELVDVDKGDNCQLMKTKKKSSQDIEKNKTVEETELFPRQLTDTYTNHHRADDPLTEPDETSRELDEKADRASEESPTCPQLGMKESWILLFLLTWINAIQSSFLLAVQVYSSLPYGLNIYGAATKAENIVDPIACFISIFITVKAWKVISALTLFGTVLASYIIVMAALSPAPLLVDHLAGGIVVVVVWILCTMVMVFTKVSIAAVMRTQGRLSLIWTGAATQAGAFVGALLAYLMVNQLGLFQDAPWCHTDVFGEV